MDFRLCCHRGHTKYAGYHLQELHRFAMDPYK